MKKLLILILLITFQFALSKMVFGGEKKVFTVNEWVEMYLRPCDNSRPAMVCVGNLVRSLARMRTYQKLTFKYLDKHDLPRWLIIVPIVESSYNPKARSPAGALGLWQLMPVNIRLYKKALTGKQIKKYGYDPVVSTQMGTRHLAMLYQKYSGYREQEKLALMAYNAGETRVNRWLKGKATMPAETRNFYNQLKAIQNIRGGYYD